MEETNKLRISLGLKPLTDDGDSATKGTKREGGREKQPDADHAEDDDHDPLKNQEEKAAKNFAEYQEQMRRKREEDEVRERIARCVWNEACVRT